MYRSLLLLFLFAAFANAILSKKDLLSKAIAKGEDAAKKLDDALPNAEAKIHRPEIDEFSPKENEANDPSEAKPKISLPEDAMFSKQNDPWFRHHHHYHHVTHHHHQYHHGQRCCNDDRLKALIHIIREQSVLLREIAKHHRVRYADVNIISEGCEDRGKHDRCGYAFIKVNGKEHSPKRRGYNVVVLNREGCFIEAKSFDTHSDRTAINKLSEFIKKIPDNSIVLMAIQDEGSYRVAHDVHLKRVLDLALRSVGCEDKFIGDYRHSWACVGYKGHENVSWVKHDQRKRARGPTDLTVKIPY